MLVKGYLAALFLSLAVFQANAEEVVTPVGLEYCTVCHGAQLKGNENIQAPRLSGLSDWYLERQLLNFKNRVRGDHPDNLTGGEMMLMAKNLSEQEIKDIVKWVVSTESPKPMATVEGDIKAGEALFQTCAACHGANAKGNEMLGAPNLSGLNDWYIFNQLNYFRLGMRGTHTADTYGQQMRAVSSVITSEKDAANLAAYIHQLK
ncbi:c-type cytochrome [Paraglaciecola sp. 2405UD69-4]|uniref:c-type cytochrome n=1 Tax=Paraglaciecola sp. 2405UD69-4 TaxID=3391836 RepID=UPI0039C8FD36